ncbi:hypothetical protein E4U60_001777 [Claviceps pazoutovae]|uniref:Uncharacterized protein n=1 Tax=Claviceps pazoutovae TaxID=1649127 RepID=A0A9P7SHN2_9HYPO|nr:hypothetical protein E4U60_001777 [Claviceps pazoutovae]
MESSHHGAHGPPEADTGNTHVTIASVTTTTLRAWGCRAYHKIMSILETGSVLKTTDFDVHWFVDRQHFTNPSALRLREPAVVQEA